MQNTYQTVGELIDNKTIPLKVWVWVDQTPIDTTNAVFTAAYPLTEGRKALVINPEHYERPEIIGTYEAYNSWVAFRFKEFDGENGKSIVLDRSVAVLPIPDSIALQQNIIKNLHIDTLDEGRMHYFEIENNKYVKMLSAKDVTLKKKYYKVLIHKKNNSEQKIEYFIVNNIVVGYTIYEYYPSCKAKTKVEINIYGRREGTKIPAYELTERTFVDKDMPPKRVEKHTKITDPKHHYWIQNILHD